MISSIIYCYNCINKFILSENALTDAAISLTENKTLNILISSIQDHFLWIFTKSYYTFYLLNPKFLSIPIAILYNSSFVNSGNVIT